MFPREQVIHGPRKLVPEDRQGLGFAVVVFYLRKIFLAIVPEEEERGFGQGPAQLHVANLFP